MTDIAIDQPAAAAPQARTGRKRILLILAGLAVVALGVWGVRRWIYSRSHESTDNAQVDGHITVVGPKIQAFVSRVLVEDNQRVKQGDTLVVLDDRDLKIRLRQAEADLQTAEAAVGRGKRIGQAQAELAATRATAAGVEASVAAAEAQFRKAAADLQRIRGLAEKKIVPAQQLDAAEAAYEAAAANLNAARKQSAAATSQVSASGAGITAAEARVLSARAMVENAKLQLSYAYILAPETGTIAKRSVEVGALVQPGQSLMSVVPEQNVWVTANMKETQLDKLHVGDKSTFTIDAYPGRTFHGHVESLSPATGAKFALLPPDNATGNFTKVVQRLPVRVALDDRPDPQAPLRPGMSAEVDIETR